MRTPALLSLCSSIESTPMSLFIQKTPWVVPLVQITHIFAIALILISALTIYSTLLKASYDQVKVNKILQQFKTFLYLSLSILFLSGSVLIIGEPARSLANEAFQMKMLFLLTALICNFFLLKQYKNTQIFSRPLCYLTLSLWLGVVFSGRWIADV
jgi:hypothetical protein